MNPPQVPVVHAPPASWWGIRCVWLRYFDVFKKNLIFSMVTTIVEPLLYLASFGLGLGAIINTLCVDGVTLTYRQFVFAGILGQTVLFQAFFEAAYGGFVRMYYQRIFQAMAMTPITLAEVLWGELLWDASKATFSAAAVLSIGVISGDFRFWGAVVMLPIAFVVALIFASIGMLCAAKSESIDQLSYPQFLFIFPMFLFCAVFYPLDNLPGWMQSIAWFLPLTALVSLTRTLTLGLPFVPFAALVLLVWLAVLLVVARGAMRSRLVK